MIEPAVIDVNALSVAELLWIARADRAIQRKEEKQACEDSLLEFVRCAWPHMGESGSFIPNWHHEVIAENIETLVWEGRVESKKYDIGNPLTRSVIVNVPPRTTKSLLLSVCLHAWVWAQPEDRWAPLSGPHVKFFCLSYGATLAEDLAVKVRRLIMGQWYQRNWGHQVTIRDDQASRSNFANTKGGERISCSIEGGLLGRGGDIQICFPADEIVWTERGAIPIGQVVAERMPIRVWSYNMVTDEIELRPLTGWHTNPGRRLLRIRTADGDLRCTEDHRILTDRGYVEARDLRLGDNLVSGQYANGVSDLAHQRLADAVPGGKTNTWLTGLRDLAAMFVRQARRALASSSVRSKSQMEPRPSSADSADRRKAHAILRRNDPQSRRGFEDFSDQFVGEVSRPVAKAAVLFAISDVLRPRTVFQSAKRRFGAIAEYVADFLMRRAWAKERQRYETMDLPIEMFAVQGESDAGVTVDDRAGHHLARHRDVAFPGTPARQAANSPEIRNFVARKAFDRQPTLARIIRIDIVHEVPASTYCVSVEHNRNMIVGQSCVLASNCDDAHHLKGAESDTQRRETLEGMRSLVTRVTDPRTSARILVMQRVHRDDATNYAIENWGPTRHLMFPMKFDPRRADPEDEREEEGELLWPEVWTEDVVRQEEKELRKYGADAQLQQAPSPKGGGIISRDWWRLWPGDYPEAESFDPIWFCALCKWHAKVPRGQHLDECPSCGSMIERHVPFPEFSYRLLSVDTAYGEKDDNSYSAATVWGIWHDKTEAPRAMLMRAWRGRPRLRGVPDSPNPAERIGLVERIHRMAAGDQVDAVLIENKSRGQDLYQELELLTREWPYQLIYTNPVVSKEIRLESCVPLFTNERVWAPDKDWADLVISEVEEQNYGHKAQHDDLSDTVSAALRHFRDSGMLSLGEEFALETRRASYFRGRTGSFDAGAEYEGS